MTPHQEQFGHAMLLCLVGVLVFSYIVALGLDAIERRSNLWYSLNAPGSPKQSAPWYVKVYEFLNG